MAPFPEPFLLLRQPIAPVVPCFCPWWWHLETVSGPQVPLGCTCRRPAAPSRDAAGCQARFRSWQAFSAARLLGDFLGRSAGRGCAGWKSGNLFFLGESWLPPPARPQVRPGRLLRRGARPAGPRGPRFPAPPAAPCAARMCPRLRRPAGSLAVCARPAPRARRSFSPVCAPWRGCAPCAGARRCGSGSWRGSSPAAPSAAAAAAAAPAAHSAGTFRGVFGPGAPLLRWACGTSGRCPFPLPRGGCTPGKRSACRGPRELRWQAGPGRWGTPRAAPAASSWFLQLPQGADGRPVGEAALLPGAQQQPRVFSTSMSRGSPAGT